MRARRFYTPSRVLTGDGEFDIMQELRNWMKPGRCSWCCTLTFDRAMARQRYEKTLQILLRRIAKRVWGDSTTKKIPVIPILEPFYLKNYHYHLLFPAVLDDNGGVVNIAELVKEIWPTLWYTGKVFSETKYKTCDASEVHSAHAFFTYMMKHACHDLDDLDLTNLHLG